MSESFINLDVPAAPAEPTADEIERTRLDEVIAEVRKNLEIVQRADGENREQAADDLRFLAGESQWDEDVRRMREAARRPCMTINKLQTFSHLVTNDLRHNVPSIHVAPVDSGADVDTAEVAQGLIRHIEYSSNADIAYDTASTSAVHVGFGYFRLVTEYCTPESFDQDIRFRRIRNAFTVYCDPHFENPDGEDMGWCIISGRVSRDDFKRQWPQSSLTTASFEFAEGDDLKDWLGPDFVRIAEYYRVVYEPDVLIELSDGSSGWKSQLVDPNGATVVRERPSARKKVEWYKCTAYEVLEHTEIMAPRIPVFPIYGDEIDVDGRVIRSGIIRHAKDPARMYNYWITAATEEVALRTKTPFIGAEGQFEGHEDEWAMANIASFPYLEYKPTSLDGDLLPPPQRQPMADIPTGFLQMSLIANDNIKATTGLFDSSLGAVGTATSGIQERAQQTQGQISNFHYSDNRMRAIRAAGRCLVGMLPHYYDAQRTVRIMGEDGKIDHVEINAPMPPEKMQAQAKAQAESGKQEAIKTIMNDMTVGQYDVTISTGPSYQTMRQEAADSQTALAKAWPKLMDVAGDIVVRNFDWPGAEEISERVKRTIPPQITQDESEDDAPVVHTPRGDIPVEQAAQMLEEMNAQMQQMAAALQEAQSGLAKAKIDAETRVQVAEINAVSAADVAELKAAVQLMLAKMPVPPVLADDVSADITENEQKPA